VRSVYLSGFATTGYQKFSIGMMWNEIFTAMDRKYESLSNTDMQRERIFK
jgi:hypothetical protein